MTNLPPGMYPPPQQPIYAQQLIPGWENRIPAKDGGGNGGGGNGDGPFAEAFDFSFNSYASLRLVRIYYILSVVLVALAYVGECVWMLLFIPPLGIGILLLGWIPALLAILAMRIRLEVTLATVRTAIDTRALRNRYVGAL